MTDQSHLCAQMPTLMVYCAAQMIEKDLTFVCGFHLIHFMRSDAMQHRRRADMGYMF